MRRKRRDTLGGYQSRISWQNGYFCKVLMMKVLKHTVQLEGSVCPEISLRLDLYIHRPVFPT